MYYVEVKDDRIHRICCGSVESEGDPKGRVFLENFEPTNGAYFGTPLNQMDKTGRMYTPAELAKKGVLQAGKHQAIVRKTNSAEYSVVPDFTAYTYYKRENGEQVNLELGQSPDNTLTKVPPTDPDATFNGKNWIVSPEVLSQRVRSKRNALLAQSDHLVMPDYPAKNLEAVKTYRQNLRDLPGVSSFPNSVTFPEPPEDLVKSSRFSSNLNPNQEEN